MASLYHFVLIAVWVILFVCVCHGYEAVKHQAQLRHLKQPTVIWAQVSVIGVIFGIGVVMTVLVQNVYQMHLIAMN